MPHGIWKGTMGFGLVSIGVEIYSVEDAERLDLDLLDKRDNSRIRYKKVSESTGAEVKPENIVKGYAVAKNRYVHLTDADLKSANPKEQDDSKVLDLMAALKRRVESQGKSRARKSSTRGKTGARKSA